MYCAVPLCKFKKKRKRSFHQLPSDVCVANKWMQIITEKTGEKMDLKAKPSICNYHFKESQFKYYKNGRRCLIKGAVPTIFDDSENTILQNDNVTIENEPNISDDSFGIESGTTAIVKPSKKKNGSNALKVENLPNVCRACLKENGNLTSMFKVVFGNSPLEKIYKDITCVEISKNDGLPTKLCTECQESLLLYVKFKMKAMLSESTLNLLQGKKIHDNCKHDHDYFRFGKLCSKNAGKNLSKCPENLEELGEDPVVISDDEDEELREITDNIKNMNRNQEFDPNSEEFEKNQEFKKSTEGLSVSRLSDDREDKIETMCIDEVPHRELKVEVLDNADNENDPLTLESVEEKKQPFQTTGKEVTVPFRYKIRRQRPTTCAVCKGKFKTAEEMKKHNSPEKRTEKCGVCNKLFSQQHLPFHMRRHGKRFWCARCQMSFGTSDESELHRAERHTKQCPECAKRVPDSSWSEHVKAHSGVKPFLCEVCGAGFLHKGNYTAHMNVHRGTKVICDVCGKDFRTKRFLAHHMNEHLGRNPFACKQCGRCFPTPKKLDWHRNSHKEKVLHPCVHCGKTFELPRSLKRHLFIKHNESVHYKPLIYGCDKCNRKFAGKGGLKLHICDENLVFDMYHQNHKRPFKCPNPYCHANFRVESQLEKHRAKCDSSRKTKMAMNKQQQARSVYNCGACDAHFSNKVDFKEHSRSHGDEADGLPRNEDNVVEGGRKDAPLTCDEGRRVAGREEDVIFPYTCDVCGEIYKDRQNLEIHIEKHNGKSEDFKCDFCHKLYEGPNTLKRHYFLHESNFRCQTCGNIYRQVDLKTHDCQARDASEPVQYLSNECKICGKICSDKSFNAHVKTHANYECKVCKKVCPGKRYLYLHMNRHKFVCELCDKGFMCKKDLNKHRERKVCVRGVSKNFSRRYQ